VLAVQKVGAPDLRLVQRPHEQGPHDLSLPVLLHGRARYCFLKTFLKNHFRTPRFSRRPRAAPQAARRQGHSAHEAVELFRGPLNFHFFFFFLKTVRRRRAWKRRWRTTTRPLRVPRTAPSRRRKGRRPSSFVRRCPSSRRLPAEEANGFPSKRPWIGFVVRSSRMPFATAVLQGLFLRNGPSDGRSRPRPFRRRAARMPP
jgi:hypothetical protein